MADVSETSKRKRGLPRGSSAGRGQSKNAQSQQTAGIAPAFAMAHQGGYGAHQWAGMMPGYGMYHPYMAGMHQHQMVPFPVPNAPGTASQSNQGARQQSKPGAPDAGKPMQRDAQRMRSVPKNPRPCVEPRHDGTFAGASQEPPKVESDLEDAADGEDTENAAGSKLFSEDEDIILIQTRCRYERAMVECKNNPNQKVWEQIWEICRSNPHWSSHATCKQIKGRFDYLYKPYVAHCRQLDTLNSKITGSDGSEAADFKLAANAPKYKEVFDQFGMFDNAAVRPPFLLSPERADFILSGQSVYADSQDTGNYGAVGGEDNEKGQESELEVDDDGVDWGAGDDCVEVTEAVGDRDTTDGATHDTRARIMNYGRDSHNNASSNYGTQNNGCTFYAAPPPPSPAAGGVPESDDVGQSAVSGHNVELLPAPPRGALQNPDTASANAAVGGQHARCSALETAADPGSSMRVPAPRPSSQCMYNHRSSDGRADGAVKAAPKKRGPPSMAERLSIFQKELQEFRTAMVGLSPEATGQSDPASGSGSSGEHVRKSQRRTGGSGAPSAESEREAPVQAESQGSEKEKAMEGMFDRLFARLEQREAERQRADPRVLQEAKTHEALQSLADVLVRKFGEPGS